MQDPKAKMWSGLVIFFVLIALTLFLLAGTIHYWQAWAYLCRVLENSFASSIVEIGKDQKVISTGPYGVVRNPMYASAAVYLIGMPLALGSHWGLVPSVLTILGLVWRLLDEEKFLAQNLPGYTEHCARVRWHLVPGIFDSIYLYS